MLRRSPRIAQIQRTLPGLTNPSISQTPSTSTTSTSCTNDDHGAGETAQMAPSQLRPPQSPLGALNKLPLELRRMVYHYLLPSDDPRYHSKGSQGSSTTIMATNSTIYEEVWHMLYEERFMCVYISSGSTDNFGPYHLNIGNHRVDLDILNHHTRLFKLDIRQITIVIMIQEYDNDNQKEGLKQLHQNVEDFVYALKRANSIRWLDILFGIARGGRTSPLKYDADSLWVWDNAVWILQGFVGALLKFEKLHRVQHAEISEWLAENQDLRELAPYAGDLFLTLKGSLERNLMSPSNRWQDEKKHSIGGLLSLFDGLGLRSKAGIDSDFVNDETMRRRTEGEVISGRS